jgi:hypothetical protein
MHQKVVLDDSSLWALLRLAYRDGLIHMKPGVHLSQLTEHTDPELELQVLEQLVLTPCALGFFDRGSLCEDLLLGDFLDSEDLVRVPTPKVSDNVEALPLELVVGILRAGGYSIPVSEFLPRLEAAMVLNDERKRRSSAGLKFPEIEDHISKALGHDKLTEEEWAFYRQYVDTRDKVSPIVSAFSHAQEVFTAAAEHSAYGMLPYAKVPSSTVVTNPNFALSSAPNDKKLILMRFVAQDIGTLLPPRSLAKTLRLSKSPEADALRHKTDEWVLKLKKGELSGLDSIQRELRRAIRSLEKTKQAKGIGAFVTLAAVPIGIAEMVLGSPGVAGLALGAIGTVAEVTVRATERRYRWALLGRDR